MTKLICRCASVYEKDVRNFRKEHPFIDIKTVLNCLNVGNGCGSCLTDSSEITDISVEEILQNG